MPFSLVEVVLALGILGIGLVQVMRLFPVGLSSVRDAVAERYAADSADHFLHQIALQLKNSSNEYANWQRYGLSLPDSKPQGEEPTEWNEWFSGPSTTCWTESDTCQFVKVEQRTQDAELADFSAIYRIWRDSVSYWNYEDGNWVEETIDEDTALGLNVEVSWPATVPYQQRQTALYRLEIFKAL
jgi:type II secretory pathway pseudopilin PulG